MRRLAAESPAGTAPPGLDFGFGFLA